VLVGRGRGCGGDGGGAYLTGDGRRVAGGLVETAMASVEERAAGQGKRARPWGVWPIKDEKDGILLGVARV